MSEHQLKDEQQRQAIQHMAETSLAVATWVNNVSAGITPEGHIRLTYGEVVHPMVPARFHGALVMPVQIAEGLTKILAQIIERHGEAKPAGETSVSVKDFSEDAAKSIN
jgi:hypothetical protein